jgi:hypothetical protein
MARLVLEWRPCRWAPWGSCSPYAGLRADDARSEEQLHLVDNHSYAQYSGCDFRHLSVHGYEAILMTRFRLKPKLHRDVVTRECVLLFDLSSFGMVSTGDETRLSTGASLHQRPETLEILAALGSGLAGVVAPCKRHRHINLAYSLSTPMIRCELASLLILARRGMCIADIVSLMEKFDTTGTEYASMWRGRVRCPWLHGMKACPGEQVSSAAAQRASQ